jgi:hypothetical protein
MAGRVGEKNGEASLRGDAGVARTLPNLKLPNPKTSSNLNPLCTPAGVPFRMFESAQDRHFL